MSWRLWVWLARKALREGHPSLPCTSIDGFARGHGLKLIKTSSDDSLWTVTLRCSFFKGEIKSVKVLSGSGNKKIDAQAVAETKGRHAPEVGFGSVKHEYWRTLTWTMPKGAPYAEPCLPPKLPEPTVLVGVPLAIVCAVTRPWSMPLS